MHMHFLHTTSLGSWALSKNHWPWFFAVNHPFSTVKRWLSYLCLEISKNRKSAFLPNRAVQQQNRQKVVRKCLSLVNGFKELNRIHTWFIPILWPSSNSNLFSPCSVTNPVYQHCFYSSAHSHLYSCSLFCGKQHPLLYFLTLKKNWSIINNKHAKNTISYKAHMIKYTGLRYWEKEISILHKLRKQM